MQVNLTFVEEERKVLKKEYEKRIKVGRGCPIPGENLLSYQLKISLHFVYGIIMNRDEIAAKKFPKNCKLLKEGRAIAKFLHNCKHLKII